jgi:hypothetical protein
MAMALCREREPVLQRVATGHDVACHLHGSLPMP